MADRGKLIMKKRDALGHYANRLKTWPFSVIASAAKHAGLFSSLPLNALVQRTRKPRLRLRYLPVPARSAMRARLSLRLSTCSTSKMGGEVVRPVSAARKGWATPPSFAPASSA